MQEQIISITESLSSTQLNGKEDSTSREMKLLTSAAEQFAGLFAPVEKLDRPSDKEFESWLRQQKDLFKGLKCPGDELVKRITSRYFSTLAALISAAKPLNADRLTSFVLSACNVVSKTAYLPYLVESELVTYLGSKLPLYTLTQRHKLGDSSANSNSKSPLLRGLVLHTELAWAAFRSLFWFCFSKISGDQVYVPGIAGLKSHLQDEFVCFLDIYVTALMTEAGFIAGDSENSHPNDKKLNDNARECMHVIRKQISINSRWELAAAFSSLEAASMAWITHTKALQLDGRVSNADATTDFVEIMCAINQMLALILVTIPESPCLCKALSSEKWINVFMVLLVEPTQKQIISTGNGDGLGHVFQLCQVQVLRIMHKILPSSSYFPSPATFSSSSCSLSSFSSPQTSTQLSPTTTTRNQNSALSSNSASNSNSNSKPIDANSIYNILADLFLRCGIFGAPPPLSSALFTDLQQGLGTRTTGSNQVSIATRKFYDDIVSRNRCSELVRDRVSARDGVVSVTDDIAMLFRSLLTPIQLTIREERGYFNVDVSVKVFSGESVSGLKRAIESQCGLQLYESLKSSELNESDEYRYLTFNGIPIESGHLVDYGVHDGCILRLQTQEIAQKQGVGGIVFDEKNETKINKETHASKTDSNANMENAENAENDELKYAIAMSLSVEHGDDVNTSSKSNKLQSPEKMKTWADIVNSLLLNSLSHLKQGLKYLQNQDQPEDLKSKNDSKNGFLALCHVYSALNFLGGVPKSVTDGAQVGVTLLGAVEAGTVQRVKFGDTSIHANQFESNKSHRSRSKTMWIKLASGQVLKNVTLAGVKAVPSIPFPVDYLQNKIAIIHALRPLITADLPIAVSKMAVPALHFASLRRRALSVLRTLLLDSTFVELFLSQKWFRILGKLTQNRDDQHTTAYLEHKLLVFTTAMPDKGNGLGSMCFRDVRLSDGKWQPKCRSSSKHEGMWDCIRCKARQTKKSKICWVCDEPNPVFAPKEAEQATSGTKMPQSATTPEETVKSEKNIQWDEIQTKPTEWSCSQCTLINPESSHTCAVCGARNPKAAQATGGVLDGGSSGWSCVCSCCTFLNDLRRGSNGIFRSSSKSQSCRVCGKQLSLSAANRKWLKELGDKQSEEKARIDAASSKAFKTFKKQKCSVAAMPQSTVDEKESFLLTVMGFPESWCKRALQTCNAEQYGAVSWLLNNKEKLVSEDFRLWQQAQSGKIASGIANSHDNAGFMGDMTATPSELRAPNTNPAFHILRTPAEPMVVSDSSSFVDGKTEKKDGMSVASEAKQQQAADIENGMGAKEYFEFVQTKEVEKLEMFSENVDKMSVPDFLSDWMRVELQLSARYANECMVCFLGNLPTHNPRFVSEMAKEGGFSEFLKHYMDITDER